MHPSGTRPTLAVSPPTDGPRTRCRQPGRPPRLTTRPTRSSSRATAPSWSRWITRKYAEARDALAPFAELEKSPEHIHTYRSRNLSLWNAAAAGLTADADGRRAAAVHQVPAAGEPADRHRRDGVAATAASGSNASTATSLRLVCADEPLLEELARQPKVQEYLGERLDDDELRRRAGLPRRAQAGADRRRLPGRGPGRLHRRRDAADRACGRSAASGLPFHVRDYQREAADVFYAGGDVRGGSGVIVLPCGAGKTIVGIAAMALMQKIDAGPDHRASRPSSSGSARSSTRPT